MQQAERPQVTHSTTGCRCLPAAVSLLCSVRYSSRARCAAATAAWMSSAEAIGTSATCSPVTGERSSQVSFPVPSVQLPARYSLARRPRGSPSSVRQQVGHDTAAIRCRLDGSREPAWPGREQRCSTRRVAYCSGRRRRGSASGGAIPGPRRRRLGNQLIEYHSPVDTIDLVGDELQHQAYPPPDAPDIPRPWRTPPNPPPTGPSIHNDNQQLPTPRGSAVS